MRLAMVRKERWAYRDNFDRLCRCISPDVMVVGGVCRNCGGLEMDERDYVIVPQTLPSEKTP